jgi:hypothetical protein
VSALTTGALPFMKILVDFSHGGMGQAQIFISFPRFGTNKILGIAGFLDYVHHHDISETASLSVLRKAHTPLVLLETGVNTDPTECLQTPSEDGKRYSFRNVVSFRIPDDGQIRKS